MHRKFDWKDFLRRLAVIAVPVALQNLLTTTGSMIDTMMIRPLGESTVGAIGLCAQYSSLMISGYWGFVGGGMLFFAQYYGAKDEKGIVRAFGLTLCCMMADALLFSTGALFFPDLVMRMYTDKAVFHPIGHAYLSIVGFAYPLQVMSMAASALLRSTERVKIPLYAAVASVVTNIFLNWVLIYGKLGMPAMGVRGAALATVCSSAVNLGVVAVCALATKYPYLFRFRLYFRWTAPFVKEYLVKIFPILCNELLIGVGNMGINIVLGRQSESAIAAIAVFRVLEGLVIGFFAGFSNAASVLVGKCVGAGELDTAYERAKRLVYLCGATISSLVAVLLLLHTPILTSMSLSGESLRIGTGLLAIYCGVSIIRMCNWVQNDTFRSAGDATYGTVLEIAFMYGLLLPAVYWAGIVRQLPILAVFAFCYVDEPIRFVLMQVHMFSGKWIKPVTPEGREALPAFREKRGRA